MDRVLSLEEKNKYVQIIETIKDKFIKRIEDINHERCDNKLLELSVKYKISYNVEIDKERIEYLESEINRICQNTTQNKTEFIRFIRLLNDRDFKMLRRYAFIDDLIDKRCTKISKRFLRSDVIEIDYDKLKNILLNEYEVSKYIEYDAELKGIKDKYNWRNISEFAYIEKNFSNELKTNNIDAELEYARFIYNLYGRDTKMEMDAYLGKYLSPEWVNINSEFNKL